MSRLEMILWAFAIGLGIAMVFTLYKKRGAIKEAFQGGEANEMTDLSGSVFTDLSGSITTITLPDISASNVPIDLTAATANLITVAGAPPEVLEPQRDDSGQVIPGKFVDLSGNVFDGPTDPNITMTVNGPILNLLPSPPYVPPGADLAQNTCKLLTDEYKIKHRIIKFSEIAAENRISDDTITALEGVLLSQYNLETAIQSGTQTPVTQISPEDAQPIVAKNVQSVTRTRSPASLIRWTDPDYTQKIEALKAKREQIQNTFTENQCTTWGFSALETLSIDVPQSIEAPSSIE
jgi:hypothetical protein